MRMQSSGRIKKLSRPIADKFNAIKAQLDAQNVFVDVRKLNFSEDDCLFFVGQIRKHFGLDQTWRVPILALVYSKGVCNSFQKVGATDIVKLSYGQKPQRFVYGIVVYPESSELDIREKFSIIKSKYRVLPSSKKAKRTPASLGRMYDKTADLNNFVIIIEPRTGIRDVLQVYREQVLEEYRKAGKKNIKKFSPLTKVQVFAATLKQQGRSNKEIKELLRSRIGRSVGSKELVKILRCGKNKMAKVSEKI